MGRSQETFSKKEVRKKKEKKRLDKEKKRLARKDSEKTGLDDMIAYVDENGMITSTPPEPGKKKKTKAEDIEVSIPKQAPADPADLIRKGRLTFYNESKGYGFIEDIDNGHSIFVHVNEFKDDILKGDKVSFEVEKGQRGLNAVRVKLIK